MKLGVSLELGCWSLEFPSHELARQNLLSDTLAGLGRKDESAVLRQGIFEKSLSVYDYQRWRELLPQTSHAMAYDHARKLALDHSDPSIAAELLLELDEMHDAEAKLISMYSAVDGGQYATLPDIGETLITKGYLRGATVVYRALLNTILERANSSAYGHAARYWHKLTQINAAAQTLAPLPSHQRV